MISTVQVKKYNRIIFCIEFALSFECYIMFGIETFQGCQKALLGSYTGTSSAFPWEVDGTKLNCIWVPYRNVPYMGPMWVC